MDKKFHFYDWKTQKISKDVVRIPCKSYDGIEDFKRDPTGFYALIKINFTSYKIELAVCNKDHDVIAMFSGQKPQDIYDAVFAFEKKQKIEIFKEKTHIAYLGKELKKAEFALVSGNNAYFQE